MYAHFLCNLVSFLWPCFLPVTSGNDDVMSWKWKAVWNSGFNVYLVTLNEPFRKEVNIWDRNSVNMGISDFCGFCCFFLCPHGLDHRAFRLSCIWLYIRPSVDQVNIFVQGRISRPINGSKLIFHMRMYLLWNQQDYTRAMTSWHIFHDPLTSDFGQIIKVKIFVQGRSSSSTSGSKLIFHNMRMYFYETSRNLQEPCLMTCISQSAEFRLWSIFHG